MKKITLFFTIILSSLMYAQAPSSAASAPTARDAENVISLFTQTSDASTTVYDDITVSNFNPNWGSTSGNVTTETLNSDNVLKYPAFNYQGIVIGSDINISGMTTMHVDIWTNGLSPNVFLISATTGEKSVNVAANAGSWSSVEIPLSDFTDQGMGISDIKELKFDGGDSTTDIYIDNIYFWKEPIAAGTDASLSNLNVSGAIISGFSPTTFAYTVGVAVGASAPQVTATATDANVSSITITQATSVPGDASVVVVSQDGSATNEYTISFVEVGPSEAAPTPPARNAEDVVSLFSNAYTDMPIDSWSATWDDSNIEDIQIEGDDVKRINFGNFIGVEFQDAGRVDATEFTHFHIDIYTETATQDKSFNLKFSNWAGGDAEANAIEFSTTNSSNPSLPGSNPGTWISLEIPFTSWNGVNGASRSDLAQFIITSNLGEVFVDNIYMYKIPTATVPTTDAPTPPEREDADVISIYSDAYTNINVTNFNPGWGQSGAVDTAYDPTGNGVNTVLEYSNFNYQGTEFDATDASAMEFVHIDIWTADATNVKFSPINNGTGAGEFLVDVPVVIGGWSSVDIAIADFTGMTWDSLFQMKFDGAGGTNPSTIYIDNVYFYKAAPFTGVALPFDFEDGENPFVANASVGTVIEDPTDAANKVLQVVGGAGDWDNIISSLDLNVNLSDDDNNTITFRIKPMNGTGSGNHLLKFEGEAGGGPNTELAFNTTGTDWETISLNFPAGLGSYSKLVLFTDAASSATDTYLIDDIAGGTNAAPPTDPAAPTVAAPTPPARNSWDVVSLFSNAYDNITIDAWSASWDTAEIEDLQIVGNDTKKITFENFIGVEFQDSNRIDATEFTHFHLDVFVTEATLDKSFNLKFSNWNGGTAEANAIEFSANNASSPAIPNPNPGTWISLDMPFSSWTGIGNASRNDLAQFLITSNLNIVYVDNIYIYRAATAGVDTNNLLNVSLSPVPATNELRISAQDLIENVTIYNVLGKRVVNATINKKEDIIDVSSLKTGVYILKYTINNAVGTMKFIKE